MNHEDLWKDVLNDATLPPQLAAISVAAMRDERRRIVRRNLLLKAGTVCLFIVGCALILFPRPNNSSQLIAAKPPAPIKKATYLNDAELAKRLRELGIGIGTAETAEGKKTLLVARNGDVWVP